MKNFFTLLFALWAAQSMATNIRGIVTDKQSGEPLVGASILLKGTQLGSSVGLDGSFVIRNVPAGTYQLVCQYIGYAPTQQSVTVGTEDIVLNVSLQEVRNTLNEVTVLGATDRETEESTRSSEQKSDNVVSIIGARAIELLPDITVGNVLQRVSGVSVTRNGSGDGQYAIIRGMDKRYNYTLVDGIKIPSPDNKNRYVPMDIFPAEILERLEVSKSLTPNMEGDAIGGAMNMVLKSAPSFLKITATGATGYSNIIGPDRPFSGYSIKDIALKSPESQFGPNYAAKPSDFGISQLQYSDKTRPLNSLFSLSIGNTILNNKLGFIVAGSYQSLYRGTNTVFYPPDEPAADPAPNTYSFLEVQLRQFSTQQKRLGLMGKLEYALNENNKIKLSSFFMQLQDLQHRNYTNPQNLGAALRTADVHDRSRYTIQKVYNISLRGDHKLGYLAEGTLKLDWTLAYSAATSNTPAWSDINVRSQYENNVLKSVRLLPVDQQWLNNSDKDKTA